MSATIRPARQEDIKTLQDLFHDLFVYDGRGDKNLNLNWPYEEGEAYFTRTVTADEACCFVAEENGELIGYVAGSILEERSSRPVRRSKLGSMFVKESHRSQGVGEQLVGAFKGWSLEQGATRCLVITYDANEGAKRFYAKMGFQPYCVELEADLKS